MIVAAAIRTPDGRIWTLPQPNRHHNIRMLIYAETKQPVRNVTEGFLCNAGKFYNRNQAFVHVLEHDQPLASDRHRGDQLVPDNELIGSILTSEDLW